jgi:hypothetical protein
MFGGNQPPYNGEEDYFYDWHKLTTSSVNASKLYFVTDKNLIISTHEGYLVSEDSGKSWNKITLRDRPLVHVLNDRVLFFLKEQYIEHPLNGAAPITYLMKSMDGGHTITDSALFDLSYVDVIGHSKDSMYLAVDVVDTTDFSFVTNYYSMDWDLNMNSTRVDRDRFLLPKRVGEVNYGLRNSSGSLFVFRYSNGTLDSLDLQIPYEEYLIGKGNYHQLNEDVGFILHFTGIVKWNWRDRTVVDLGGRERSIWGWEGSWLRMLDEDEGYLAAMYGPFFAIRGFDKDTVRWEFSRKYMEPKDVSYFGPNPGNNKLYLFTNEGIWTKDLK